MNNLINRFHRSIFFGFFIRTLDYCLQKELKDCQTVLDIGCGPSSPLQRCPNIKYSVGVEPFLPYLNLSKRRKIHSEYIAKKIEDLDFPKKCFDAVIMIEVIEHLQKKTALEIMKKASLWAKKKIIISTPNGYLDQKELDNNPLQKHLSGWDYKTMKQMGYTSYGLAGLKFLRRENDDPTMGDNLMSSIKFKPKFFWFIVATISQIFTYYFPLLAFELFSVKKI